MRGIKVLYPWRLLGAYYAVAVDATGTLTFTDRHCLHRLTKTLHGQTFYYHNVLQASIVTPVGLVFPFMTEFIENPDEDPEATNEKEKQDCELKAFHRLASRLPSARPMAHAHLHVSWKPRIPRNRHVCPVASPGGNGSSSRTHFSLDNNGQDVLI